MVPRDAASALDGRDGASKAAPLSHRDPSPLMLGLISTAPQKTPKLKISISADARTALDGRDGASKAAPL